MQIPRMGREIFTHPNIMFSYDILKISKEQHYGEVMVMVDSFSKWTASSRRNHSKRCEGID